MIYLSGAIRPELYGVRNVGFALNPNMGNRPDLSRNVWMADNGCFSQGESFRAGRFITWLEEPMAPYRETCLFAVAPDVLCDAEATWRRSAPFLPIIRSLGYKVALVAQNGMEHMKRDYSQFDVLFIGGDTAWKLSQYAEMVAGEAISEGLEVHMGRVNAKKRMIAAAAMGCRSVDGTYLAFGPDKNIPRLLSWVDFIDRQPLLFGAA